MEKKLYIVHQKCVQGYETRWEDYNVYSHEDNALNKLQAVKREDMMPIVEEENWEVKRDEPKWFEARRAYDGGGSYVIVKIITTFLEDGHVEH